MPRGDAYGRVRAALPFVLVPLAMLATGLAAAPWLRAYPSDLIAAPLFGAAALSVLTPVVVVGIGVRRLWATALIDLVVYAFFTTLVGLHDPVDPSGLWSGLVHGPSQILTFALPLVSPRSLLVAPMTLCWIAGAVLGECLARSWHSLLPYATLLAGFGLAYAGSVRGVTSLDDGRRYDVILAGALLLTMLVMRAIEAWIEQDLDSEVAQPDGRLPLRGLGIGVVVALVVTAAAGAGVSSEAFSGPPSTPDRQPPLDRAAPLSPVAFVAGLRPTDPTAKGASLFSVRVDHATTNYVGIADVDDYDGEGWTFHRTFRPSGGSIPGESDPGLRPRTRPVTQQYTIDPGALTSAPWMPFLFRPQQVSGAGIDVDSTSGMIVPAQTLRAGETYSVTSDVASTTVDDLPSTASAATSEPPEYTFVPGDVSASLGTVLTSFENETGTPDTDPVTFLQALTHDLRSHYTLSGGRGSTGSPSPTTPTASASPSGSAGSSANSRPAAATGGTGFATVLASILGPNRAATPEQYATLVALLARQLGLPARLVSGFRVGTRPLRPGHDYTVRASDAWTWVEIPIQGRGWLVLDPSPARAGTGQAQPSSPAARPTQSATPTVTPHGLATQGRNGHAVAPKSSVPAGSHPSSLSVLAIVLGAVALGIVLAIVILWGRKWLRIRRRRRRGDPRARLLGAWQESLDVLVESGLDDPTSLTSAEVAAETERRFGGEPAAQARYLGDGANVALFSPTTWIGQAEADAAWHAQAVLRRTVRRRLGFRQRVGAR
ncbi:transglutaminase domain-containing protein, partial [Jatrophihabitans endophyticus]|uniref:transglutaminase family protein n=1 Tax=Jatrophihabitans endophyticus TaxID=1206085 RepID=UPI001A089F8F